jgi:predicted DNA-binding protein
LAGLSKRVTVYLEPDLHKALKLKSVETSRSVSDLINVAIQKFLADDVEDIVSAEKKIKQPLISYNEMVMRLKKNGLI